VKFEVLKKLLHPQFWSRLARSDILADG